MELRIHGNHGKAQCWNLFSTMKGKKGKKNEEWIKCLDFWDAKWLKQFLFKCKFDFLKDEAASNCTLNGKMKINLKYGMNNIHVDFQRVNFIMETLMYFLLLNPSQTLDSQVWHERQIFFNVLKRKRGQLIGCVLVPFRVTKWGSASWCLQQMRTGRSVSGQHDHHQYSLHVFYDMGKVTFKKWKSLHSIDSRAESWAISQGADTFKYIKCDISSYKCTL